MTDATEALARAEWQDGHLSEADLTDAAIKISRLAALGYEVRPIEKLSEGVAAEAGMSCPTCGCSYIHSVTAEAADREAAGGSLREEKLAPVRSAAARTRRAG